jgi:prolyl-tRNA editing enzyme YbaK/EbsC (Cys-tRNA(Pro) deacylase)
MAHVKRWSKDEYHFLRMNAAMMPPDRLAEALGRTVGAVRSRAAKKRIRLLLDDQGDDALASERNARIRSRPL